MVTQHSPDSSALLDASVMVKYPTKSFLCRISSKAGSRIGVEAARRGLDAKSACMQLLLPGSGLTVNLHLDFRHEGRSQKQLMLLGVQTAFLKAPTQLNSLLVT